MGQRLTSYALYPSAGEDHGGGAWQEDDKKRKQQFTWDLAATSQSPVLPGFGIAGAWGIWTTEEENK